MWPFRWQEVNGIRFLPWVCKMQLLFQPGLHIATQDQHFLPWNQWKQFRKLEAQKMAMRRLPFYFSLNDADVTEKYDTVFMKTSRSDAAPAYGQATRVFPFYSAGGCLLPALGLQWNTAAWKAFCSVKYHGFWPLESVCLCRYNRPKRWIWINRSFYEESVSFVPFWTKQFTEY